MAAVDRVLKPMGFERNGREWLRHVGSIEEGVDLQWSQFAGTTANLWSEDLATEDLLRKAAPWLQPGTMLTFPTRIGFLISKYDIWWKNDPKGPTEIAEALQTHAERFFESQRSLEDQALIYGRREPRWKPGSTVSRIKLALTLYRMGEVDEACNVLANPPKTISEEWRRRGESVREWIRARAGNAEGPDPKEA